MPLPNWQLRMASTRKTNRKIDTGTNSTADDQPARPRSGGGKYKSYPKEVESCHEETEQDQWEPGL